MHNQNNGSIVFKLCISIVWGGGESMCTWPFVVSSLPKEAAHALATPGAGENLSTSLFVKEYFARCHSL